MMIRELFDTKTSFPLEWDTQFADSGEVHADAHDADGRVIHISFVPVEGGPVTEVVFTRGGSYEMTGAGDAARVMATVIVAITAFVKEYKPHYLAFSAKSTGGRASAYAAMIKRLATNYELLSPDEYTDDILAYLEHIGSDQPFILARI